MPLATSDIDFLRDMVAQHSGNVIAARQGYMLEQRLTPLAGIAGLDNVQSLVEKLRSSYDSSLSDRVAEAVTVNETSFFRGKHFFDALQRDVLPNLIKKNADRKEIRIWSAACSSGQEPYSIAMLLRDHFPQLSDWNVRIVATDLSEEMLRRSRSGRYSRFETNRGLSTENLIKHFDRRGAQWQVKPELAAMVEHRRMNLTQPWPFLGHFDLVLIRNVLIYFDQQTKCDILRRAQHTMRPEGYLFIGSAETLIGLSLPYQRKEIDAAVCYRPTAL